MVERPDRAVAAQWLRRAAGMPVPAVGRSRGGNEGHIGGSGTKKSNSSRSGSASDSGIANRSGNRSGGSSVLVSLRGGCATGMHHLALCSLLHTDPWAAVELLETAAQRGRVASMRALGWLFRDGNGDDDESHGYACGGSVSSMLGSNSSVSGNMHGSGSMNVCGSGGGSGNCGNSGSSGSGVASSIVINSGSQRDIGSGRRFGIPADRKRAQYWFERGARTNGDTEACGRAGSRMRGRHQSMSRATMAKYQ